MDVVISNVLQQPCQNSAIREKTKGGRDSSVGGSSTSHAGDLGLNSIGGLTRVTPMHEGEGKRFTTVKA